MDGFNRLNSVQSRVSKRVITLLLLKRGKQKSSMHMFLSLVNIFSQANNFLFGPFPSSTYYVLERKLSR